MPLSLEYLPSGHLGPHPLQGSFGLAEYTHQKRHLDWLSHFSTARGRDRQTQQPFQEFIYAICYSQLSITFAVFDMFVCISFMCLRVHVDLIRTLAARNNKRCL